MPYIPRRLATTIGVPPELQPPPREHAPIPVPPDQEQPSRRRFGLEKINPKTYEPAFKKIFKTMFGMEPDIDESTGQLVFTGARPRTGATFGTQQAGADHPK